MARTARNGSLSLRLRLMLGATGLAFLFMLALLPVLQAAFSLAFERVIEERLAALQSVSHDPKDPETLRRIIEAFTGPVLKLRASAEGEYYALLVARELYHALEETDRVLRAYFDPMAHAFIDALQEALPHATRGQVAWCYQFGLGALLHHLSDNRIERLSLGESRPGDPAAAALLVTFIAGGIRAALPPPSSSPPKTNRRQK